MLPGRGYLNAAPGPFSQENMSLRSFVDGAGVEEKVRCCCRWWAFRRVEGHSDGVAEERGCDDEDVGIEEDEDEVDV